MSWVKRTLTRLPLRWIFEAFYLSASDPWRYWRSEFEHHRYDEAMRLLRRFIEPGRSILEVGCSVGAFTRRLLSLSPSRLIAMDVSAIALVRARRAMRATGGQVKIGFVCGDVFSDKRPLERCDLIVAMDVLGYTDDLETLRATRDRLIGAAPRGLLLVGNTKLAAQDGEGFAPFASGFPRLGARAIIECISERASRLDGYEESRFRLDILQVSDGVAA